MIMLDEEYCIDVLPIDYALAKIRRDKSGKTTCQPLAYYGNIGKCLKEYTHISVHNALLLEADISLQEALKRAEQAIRRCIKVINIKFPDYDFVKNDNDDVLMKSRSTL